MASVDVDQDPPFDAASPMDLLLTQAALGPGPRVLPVGSALIASPSRATGAIRWFRTVTVGPVAWNLDSTSYWWPNVPYRSGYRAQLHGLAVHAVTDDGRTSDAEYRFGFREATQNGDYYYLNGVRVNFRGDNLQGADYDRINNGGKGDAYHTLPGFLPPSSGNGGWPQAVDNYQRLNYNVVRIHQGPASPYMLDVADEMGLMIIGEVAIRGSQSSQEWRESVGRNNMVNHARALVWARSHDPEIDSAPLFIGLHPAVIRATILIVAGANAEMVGAIIGPDAYRH